MDNTVRYPEVTVDLTSGSVDGNAFSIIGTVCGAMAAAGVSNEERDEYMRESMSGDYDHLLQTAMRWVNVE